jgi:hypothetical protein
MELTQTLIGKAAKTLQFEGVSGLPKQIGNTPFYIAEAKDTTILAHGVIQYEGVEYKIGTKKAE